MNARTRRRRARIRITTVEGRCWCRHAPSDHPGGVCQECPCVEVCRCGRSYMLTWTRLGTVVTHVGRCPLFQGNASTTAYVLMGASSYSA